MKINNFNYKKYTFDIICLKEGGDLLPKDSEGNMILSDVDYLETWEGMEECVRQGLTRSIGISNFNSEQITRLLTAAQIKPVNNQVTHFNRCFENYKN